MEDDNNWQELNWFERTVNRLMERIITSRRFLDFAANNSWEKRRERRELQTRSKLRLIVPLFGLVLLAAGLSDFHASLTQRVIPAVAGLALLWLGQRLWRRD